MAGNNSSAEERLNEFLNGETREASDLFRPEPPEITEEHEQKTEEAPQPNTTENTNQEQPDRPEPAPALDAATAAEISSAIVDFLNNGFKIGAKTLYPKYLLEDGDEEALNDLNTKVRTLCPPLDASQVIKEETEAKPALAQILLRYEKTSKAIKDAPFTADERESLVKPLAALVKKYAFLQFGPETMFFFAVCLVMLPRITPLIPGFGDFISGTIGKQKE